jgi:peptidoglycan/xylan/chitin deacetylase (PgdA/CDA1 family)
MPRTTLFTLIVIFACLLASSVLISANDGNWTLYGNEPSLANNILLTIDDASIEANVRTMFHLLREQSLTATFFPNMRYLTQQDPQLWQEIAAAGFEIGYHTRNHNSHLTPEELTADFNLFQDELRVVLNNPTYTIRYVRPPNGVWDANWTTWANANNLFTVRWNVTSATDDMNYIEAVLSNHRSGGSIILLHTDSHDVLWLQHNLSRLMALRDDQQRPYQITTLSRALSD